MKTFYFIFSIVIFLSPLVSHATDLLELYEIAEQNDPQYQQAISNHRAILEKKPQAWAQLKPILNFSSNSTFNDQSQTTDATGFGPTTNGDVEFNSRGYRLDLTQPIFRLDRIRTLDQSDYEIKQAATNIQVGKQDLMIRLAESYFAVLTANDNLQFAYAEEESLKRQLEQAEQRFDVGLIAITDVQEATAGFDRAYAQKIRAENEIDVSEERLREIVGEYDSSLNALNQEMPLLKPEPLSIDDWTQSALEENLEIQAARYGADIAKQIIKINRAGHYPTVDLVASRGYGATGGRFGGFSSHDTTVGIELNIPLYQGGGVSSRVREAVELHEVSIHSLEQARRKTERETRTSYLNVISGISEVEALKQAVVSSETALEATQTGFEVGTRTAVDVVTAERAVQEAKRNYSTARYEYILDTLRLKRAAGSLSQDDLRYVSSWLN